MIRSRTEADAEGAGCKCGSTAEHDALEARVSASYLRDRERAELRLANTAWLMRRGAGNAERISEWRSG